MTPTFRITIDGKDLTSSFAGIARFTLTDNRAFVADTLSISITDPSDSIELPSKGATVHFDLGTSKDRLINKGSYVVDGIGFEGPPDTINITARSANLKESINVPKAKSFKDKSLLDILTTIAKAQGLTPEINPDLGALAIKHLDQTNESDGHLLSRLGRLYGAVATIKEDRLIFTPLSRGTTAAGTPLDALTIKRNQCSNYNFNQSQRASEFTAVCCRYHDQSQAKTIKVTVESSINQSGKTKIKTLSEIFPDEIQARAAAVAELQRLSDGGTTMNLTLADGMPDLIPEIPVNASGFKKNIDDRKWVCDQVTHSLGNDGLTTKVKLVPLAL